MFERCASYLAIASAIFSVAGCSPVCMSGCTANTATLRTRASFDMECPEKQLKLTKLNDPLTADGTVYGLNSGWPPNSRRDNASRIVVRAGHIAHFAVLDARSTCQLPMRA